MNEDKQIIDEAEQIKRDMLYDEMKEVFMSNSNISLKEFYRRQRELDEILDKKLTKNDDKCTSGKNRTIK